MAAPREVRQARTGNGERVDERSSSADLPTSSQLVIRPADGKPLSREQRAFNRLTARIAELERSIVEETSKLELLLDRYMTQVAPREKALARAQIELARALATASKRLNLRKKQKDLVGEIVRTLCNEAFETAKPDAETETFYDEWSEKGYREEQRLEAEDLKRVMANGLRARFGIDTDIPEGTSPEEMARFFHKLREKERAAMAEPPPHSKDSAKGPARPARRGRSASTARSLREIYLSLAKVLHPDVVMDGDGKMREHSMKQAVRAYRESDITALLALELRWLAKDQAACSALPDDALRRYIPALKEQAARLEDFLQELARDSRYEFVQLMAMLDEPRALAEMKKRAQELRQFAVRFGIAVQEVKRCAAKDELMELITQYLT